MDIQTVACPLLHNLSEQTNYGQVVQISCSRFIVKQAVCSDSYTTKHLVRGTLKPDETADNLPYEKVGNNEPVCIVNEVPFDIPDSWEWVRLGSIGDWGSGATPSRTNTEYYGGDIPWLKTGDLNDGYIKHIPESISHLALEKTSVRLNETGSVLIAMYGATIGKVGILTFPATTNQACCACLPIEIYNEYLFYFLMSQKSAFVKRGEGGAQPNISKGKIISTLMPLPSITEQYRIVAKIKKVLPLVEQYEVAYSEVNSLNNSFPELLKKSILQEAVQGKLVPQDPNDEPASVLLERIRAEKQALIKAGKIKKDKNESVIFRRDNSHYEKLNGIERCIDAEIPFDIPDNWEWITLKMVAISSLGKTLDKAKNQGEFKPYLCSINVYWSGINLSTVKEARFEKDELSKYCLKEGDLLICEGGDVGRSAIWRDNREMYYQNALHRVRFFGGISPDYFHMILECYKNNKILEENSKGMTIKHLVQSSLNSIYFPLPPLKEQHRIVATYKSILPALDQL